MHIIYKYLFIYIYTHTSIIKNFLTVLVVFPNLMFYYLKWNNIIAEHIKDRNNELFC